MIRALAFVGLVISVYLFSMKLRGEITSVIGCGGEGGCANVLGSQWSQWFGIPVSAVSTLLYVGVIALTLKGSQALLKAAAILLIGAAVWFMGLQAFVIKSFCPWCFATHLVGLATAAAILWKASAKLKPALVVAPLVLLLGLALGQVYGPKPDTYEVTTEDEIEERKEVKEQTSGEGRLIEFKLPDGRVVKTYRLGSVPFLGSADAKRFVVKYFDYTCASCLDMEGDLEALLARYPKEVGVILMPSPLNRACNPYLSNRIKDHQYACELARLGLAAWKAQPDVFEEAHEILFHRPILNPASAKAKLEALISAEKLEAALKDPWVEKSLQANLKDYQLLSSRRIEMPKLIVTGSKTVHGLLPSTEEFVRVIGEAFQLK